MSAGPTTRRSALRDRSSSGGFIPGQSGSYNDRDENEWWTDRELSLIENALKEHGEMKRDDIGELLGCRYWGPRRFARALKIGVEEGRFRRVRRGVYGPA